MRYTGFASHMKNMAKIKYYGIIPLYEPSTYQ